MLDGGWSLHEQLRELLELEQDGIAVSWPSGWDGLRARTALAARR